jgi:hypothetical protein
MPAFRADDFQRNDFRIVGLGVSLYWRDTVLAEAVDELGALEYKIVDVDAAGWTTADDLYDAIAAALDFPNYFGRNVSALNDCLNDVADYGYGSDESAAGTILVLRHYDGFARVQPELAHAVLDSFQSIALGARLIGHRMACLVQSDDPRLEFAPVGAAPVIWNPKESLRTARGL